MEVIKSSNDRKWSGYNTWDCKQEKNVKEPRITAKSNLKNGQKGVSHRSSDEMEIHENWENLKYK